MAHGPFHVVERNGSCLAFFRKRTGDNTFRFDADGNLVVFSPQNDGKLPFRHVAEGIDFAERNTPVSRNVDLRDRSAIAAQRIVTKQTILQRLAGIKLQLRVERRANGKPAFVKRVLSIAGDDVAADLFGEILAGKEIGSTATRRHIKPVAWPSRPLLPLRNHWRPSGRSPSCGVLWRAPCTGMDDNSTGLWATRQDRPLRQATVH